ncbi:MAG: FMN-binding protein [Planctomycetota bacterium]
MKGNYLRQGWLVLILALVFGGALAGVELGLSGRIEANKRAEAQEAIRGEGDLPALVPGAARGEQVTMGGQQVYRTLDEAGEPVGWVIHSEGQGFAGPIEVLVGTDMQAREITGLYVLAQTETPGLGDTIAQDPDWRAQFVGKNATRPVVVTKASPSGNQIRAVTGATISSQSVTRIVNTALAEFRDNLAQAAEEE